VQEAYQKGLDFLDKNHESRKIDEIWNDDEKLKFMTSFLRKQRPDGHATPKKLSPVDGTHKKNGTISPVLPEEEMKKIGTYVNFAVYNEFLVKNRSENFKVVKNYIFTHR